MDRKKLIGEIVDLEWDMFQRVHNNGGRASCQNDSETFYGMRCGQFLAWETPVLESYARDLKSAQGSGRNLLAEKYLRMMESTFPQEYELQKDRLPEVSERAARLAEEICIEMIVQTAAVRDSFPLVGGAGRPLYSSEDRPGDTSVETYQRGELLTYSEPTLELLHAQLFEMKARGESLAAAELENSVCHYGYESIKHAEDCLRSRQGG